MRALYTDATRRFDRLHGDSRAIHRESTTKAESSRPVGKYLIARPISRDPRPMDVICRPCGPSKPFRRTSVTIPSGKFKRLFTDGAQTIVDLVADSLMANRRRTRRTIVDKLPVRYTNGCVRAFQRHGTSASSNSYLPEFLTVSSKTPEKRLSI